MTVPTRNNSNWANTYQFRASQVVRPTSVDELVRSIDAHTLTGTTMRCVGSKHSFTGIADAETLIDLAAMPEQFEVSANRQSVTVNGSMTYSRLAELLDPAELAVANTASLPHLSIAGATATGTHGSGDNNGNLATSIRALEIATSTGDIRRVALGEPDFATAAIGLGALGAIVSVELDVEPAFQIEQHIHTGLVLADVTDTFDQLFGSAYSVSVFTDWRERLDVWTKRRLDQPPPNHRDLHAGMPATTALHPVPGQDPTACTVQGPPGLWSERLPHFRSDAVPSVGAEVQSEFFVDRSDAAAAIQALHAIGSDLQPALMTSEIRTVRRDDLWLSAQHERDCCAFHFTWHHDLPAAHQAAHRVAHALAPFRPLPHWGKVFDPTQFELPQLFPRFAEALAVISRWDPSGLFMNRWMRETIHKQS